MTAEQKPSTDFLNLWERSDSSFKTFDNEPKAISRTNIGDRLSGTRSAVWSNFSTMSASDQAQVMSQLARNWPYPSEKCALTWPMHAILLTNCVTSSLIATRINADMVLFEPKAGFLSAVQRCPKSPFVFGVYASGVTSYVLQQTFITSKIYDETEPCSSCVLINSIAIGLATGIVIPMLATPYLAHYVMIQREANNNLATRMPEVKNLLEFLTLGWEGSRSARSLLLKLIPLQIAVAAAGSYALLWGRSRMFNSLDADPDLAKELILKAQSGDSFKYKVQSFLTKIPFFGGMVDNAPETERVA